MTEPKHTPGPWKVLRPIPASPNDFTKIIGPNGEVIDLFGSGYFNNKNIDLIVDAWQLPELRREIKELKAINKEMVEALEYACDSCDEILGKTTKCTSVCILGKALRKARGEANNTNSEEMNQ